MRFQYCIVILLSVATVLRCDDDSDNIPQWTDSDFDAEAASHETALVMFYAPWCGHCKRLKPEFDVAVGILAVDDPPVALAKVDCTDSGKAKCGEYGVSGYPTLKIFRDGQVSQDYNGPRDANGIVKYMKSQVGPSAKQLDSLDDLNKLLNKPEVVVVGFFSDADSKLKAAFLKLADVMRETTVFGLTSDETALKKHDASDNVILFRPKNLHNKFEPASVRYEGEAAKSDMQAWVKENYHGLVGVRTRDNARDFQQPLVVAYFKVDYVKNAKGTNYWRNRVMKVAQDFADDFKFAIAAQTDFQNEMEEYGMGYSDGTKPVVGARNSQGLKFVMKEEFTMDTFRAFLSDLKSGKLEPYIKSEAVPASNDGPVKVAVAKNFEDLVTNNEKDVLIEFYAPWCGHCKKLAPVFDELGEKMAEENVEIVKMDATANDVPPAFSVSGFPTLYWLPKNKKDKPISYQGGRDLDAFVKYIAKEATDELKGYDRKGKAKKTEL